MMHPIMTVCRKSGLCGCVRISSEDFWQSGNVITIGDIQAFIQYVKNFTQPIQQIAQVINHGAVYGSSSRASI